MDGVSYLTLLVLINVAASRATVLIIGTITAILKTSIMS